MIVVWALLSAMVFGTGVVLQQRAALEVPSHHAARPSLLIRLVQRPLWLFGLGADVIGFGLQTVALHHGSLVVVQPLLTTALLFTLVMTAALYHDRISAPSWAAIFGVTGGLSLFLAAAAPNSEGTASADTLGWLLCLGTVALTILAALGVGLRAVGAARAGWFGLAAGLGDAGMAVLAKAFAGSFDHGLTGVFESWTPYALVIGGISAMLLISTAYQAGYPTVSLPIITVSDPLVGSLIGILLFGDRLRLGGVRGPLVVLSLIITAAGLITLGRDRRLASEIAGEIPAGVVRPA